MSYLVMLERARSRPIEPDEFLIVIESDPELSMDDELLAEDVHNVWWKGSEGAEPVAFVLSGGIIEVTSPSNATLRKMQELAVCLDALVIGEEGEDLTTVDVPDFNPLSMAGVAGCLAVLIALAAAALFLMKS